MAASAMLRRLLFPFVRESRSADGKLTRSARVVSKDRIPWPSTAHESYPMRGCENDTIFLEPPFQPSARKNCCWIEVTLHALLSDPFLRYFVIDYGAKVNLAGSFESAFPSPPLSAALSAEDYTRGALYMRILHARYSLADTLGQESFNYQFDTLYADLRKSVDVSRPSAAGLPAPKENDDMMGVTAELLTVMLPCVRLFIALHWSGSAFQRQFLAYGCVPLATTTLSCTGKAASCVLRGRERVGYDEWQTQLDEVDMIASPVIITTEPRVGVQSLQTLLTQLSDASLVRFGGRWELWSIRICGPSCHGRRIVKRTLTTLPWMLYIETARSQIGQMTLQYNPDSLTLGPTADGQYATYKLVCRVSFAYAHYKADVRDPVDGTFTNWNFASATPSRIPFDGDTTCAVLVWQRME